MKPINILVAGVGGQGTILASDIIAEVGMKAGYDVKKSDVLGLAVRGGSVTSHVRWDPENVNAPMAPEGTIDYLISFEKLEALRNIDSLKEGGTILVNEQEIHPEGVTTGEEDYPSSEEIREALVSASEDTYYFDGLGTAEELGTSKVLNVVILGAFSNFVEAEEEVWEEVISESVPPKFTEVNLNAFSEGRKLLEGDKQ